MNLLSTALLYWLACTLLNTPYCFIVMILGLIYINWRFNRSDCCIFLLLMLVLTIQTWRLNNIPSSINGGKVVAIYENSYKIKTKDAYFIMYSGECLQFDDEVIVSGKMDRIHSNTNFHLFSYERFAYLNNIKFTLKADSVKLVERRSSIKNTIYNYLRQQKSAFSTLALRLLFNINSEEFSIENNLFLSSGLYLTTFFYHIERLIAFVIPYQSIQKWGMIIPIIYGFCTNFNISVLRAIIKRVLYHLHLDKASTLGILILVLLVINPAYSFNFAFIFPITLALSNIFNCNVLPKFIYRQVVMFPLILNSAFNYNILLSFCFNLFKKIYYSVFILVLLTLYLPMLQFIPLSLFTCINALYNQLQTLNFLNLYGRLDTFFVVGYYICLFNLIYYKDIFKLLIIVFMNVILIKYYPFDQIIMQDIGQGDSFIYKMKFNQGIILIDAGSNKFKNIGKDIIAMSLKSLWCNEIDYVFITHNDFDHNGSLEYLNKNFKIKNIVTNTDFKAEYYLNYQTFKLLNVYDEKRDENDNSLIIYFEIDGLSFLFSGDISKSGEEELIKRYDLLNVDVLKLAHHGSKTSSSYYFLEQLNPSIALISAGENNIYKHPSQAVLDDLKTLSIPYLNTAKHGGVRLVVFMQRLYFNSSKS